MTPHDERSAEALAVWRRHGNNAAQHVAAQIGALASIADWRGVERWKQIATAMDALMRAPRQ